MTYTRLRSSSFTTFVRQAACVLAALGFLGASVAVAQQGGLSDEEAFKQLEEDDWGPPDPEWKAPLLPTQQGCPDHVRSELAALQQCYLNPLCLLNGDQVVGRAIWAEQQIQAYPGCARYRPVMASGCRRSIPSPTGSGTICVE